LGAHLGPEHLADAGEVAFARLLADLLVLLGGTAGGEQEQEWPGTHAGDRARSHRPVARKKCYRPTWSKRTSSASSSKRCWMRSAVRSRRPSTENCSTAKLPMTLPMIIAVRI